MKKFAVSAVLSAMMLVGATSVLSNANAEVKSLSTKSAMIPPPSCSWNDPNGCGIYDTPKVKQVAMIPPPSCSWNDPNGCGIYDTPKVQNSSSTVAMIPPPSCSWNDPNGCGIYDTPKVS